MGDVFVHELGLPTAIVIGTIYRTSVTLRYQASWSHSLNGFYFQLNVPCLLSYKDWRMSVESLPQWCVTAPGLGTDAHHCPLTSLEGSCAL